MLSRRKFLLASGALLGSGFSWAVPVAGSRSPLQLRVEYTATSLIDADERISGRLWRTPTALRHENAQQGGSLTVIARLDRNLVWVALVDPPIAIETDLSALDLPLEVLKGGGDMRVVRQGRERVNGLDTMRIRVERKASGGSSFRGLVWATDQGVIARLEGEGENHGRRGRTMMNFRDIQVGRVDPVLFEAPRNLQWVHVKGADLATLLGGPTAAGPSGRRR